MYYFCNCIEQVNNVNEFINENPELQDIYYYQFSKSYEITNGTHYFCNIKVTNPDTYFKVIRLMKLLAKRLGTDIRVYDRSRYLFASKFECLVNEKYVTDEEMLKFLDTFGLDNLLVEAEVGSRNYKEIKTKVQGISIPKEIVNTLISIFEVMSDDGFYVKLRHSDTGTYISWSDTINNHSLTPENFYFYFHMYTFQSRSEDHMKLALGDDYQGTKNGSKTSASMFNFTTMVYNLYQYNYKPVSSQLSNLLELFNKDWTIHFSNNSNININTMLHSLKLIMDNSEDEFISFRLGDYFKITGGSNRNYLYKLIEVCNYYYNSLTLVELPGKGKPKGIETTKTDLMLLINYINNRKMLLIESIEIDYMELSIRLREYNHDDIIDPNIDSTLEYINNCKDIYEVEFVNIDKTIKYVREKLDITYINNKVYEFISSTYNESIELVRAIHESNESSSLNSLIEQAIKNYDSSLVPVYDLLFSLINLKKKYGAENHTEIIKEKLEKVYKNYILIKNNKDM